MYCIKIRTPNGGWQLLKDPSGGILLFPNDKAAIQYAHIRNIRPCKVSKA